MEAKNEPFVVRKSGKVVAQFSDIVSARQYGANKLGAPYTVHKRTDTGKEILVSYTKKV